MAVNRIEAGMVATRNTIEDMKRKVRGRPPMGAGGALEVPLSVPALVSAFPRLSTWRGRMRRLAPVAEEEAARRASLDSQRSSHESARESGESGDFSLDSSDQHEETLQSIKE